MKNLVKFLVPAAVAALALVSCNKENNYTAPDANAVTIRVHASADALKGDDPETKTYIDNTNTILWGTDEYMKLAVTAGEETAFSDSDEANANGNPAATFSFSINPASAASYLYQGLYPASAAVTSSNANAANYKVVLPGTQNATASSYDPSAYIMVAKPESFNQVETDWQVSFRRATALNKITLKNVPDGKSIKRVVITAPSGKYLAGGRHIDLSSAENGDIYAGGGRTESVEVKFATPLTGTNVDVWFTSWDVEVEIGETLTIVAYTTDKKSYTKTIVPTTKSIKFQEQYLNTLGANMSGLSPVDVTELEDGNYVILAKNGDNYFAMKAETTSSDTRMASVDYTKSTSSYAGDADLIWTVSKSGSSYTIENDGKYLGYSGNDNKAFWNAAGETWTETNYLIDITWDGTNSCYHATLNSASSRKLGRNASSDWFAFYTSDQQNNLIFVPATVDSRTAVTLSFANGAISKTTANYSEFTGQVVTASPNVSAITSAISYAMTGDAIGTISGSTVTLNGQAGTATITASFAGDATYRAAEASYTITVEDSSQITLTFPFDSAISGWPAASGDSAAGSYTYDLAGTDYTFTHTKVGNGIYCQTSYLMITSGNYLGLPAISGYKLTSVSAQLNAGGNPSTASQGTITSDTSGSVVTGGETQAFDTKGDSKTFTLTGTAENTVYYLAISNKNFQCTELVLVYEVVAPDTRDEAGLAWKKSGIEANSDNASIEDADDVLPTIVLDNPNSLSVTYSSSNTSVATIVESGSGAGTISLVAAGTSTISAIFAGNDDYKPATVEYTLTVTDNRSGGDSVVYTLTPASGSNNSYAGNCDITISGITWNLTGNSTTQPWRLGGGKNTGLSNVDRAIYSKTALNKNISKIEITHGTASGITVNSMTVIVSNNSDFSNPVSTLTPDFASSAVVTVNRPNGVSWSNCYYKIVYNVTVSGTSNKFVEFSEAKFYGTN